MTAVDTKDCKFSGTGDRREFIYIFSSFISFFFLLPESQPLNHRSRAKLPRIGGAFFDLCTFGARRATRSTQGTLEGKQSGQGRIEPSLPEMHRSPEHPIPVIFASTS